jgi:hypothetical protein
MTRHWPPTVLVIAVSLTVAFGNWNDTSTGIDLDKLRHFPLTKIRSGWLKHGKSATFDGMTATDVSGNLQAVRLRGIGRSGKRWESRMFGIDEVWRADLDGNGTQDYVFFGGGPYFNGSRTPLYSLTILLLDRDRLPVPFFTVVYHGENGDGIKHLVDLNHDGHAELLISTYDENVSDPLAGPSCSGHWTNQLYRFKDFGAEEIRETIGGITFPFVHDWTYRGTQCAAWPTPFMPAQEAAIGDDGTSKQGAPVTTIRDRSIEVGAFTIEPVAGCKAIFPSLVVYDRPQIREIGFPSQFGTDHTDLAETIRRDGAQVELRGINRQMGNVDCSVNLLWATSRK